MLNNCFGNLVFLGNLYEPLLSCLLLWIFDGKLYPLVDWKVLLFRGRRWPIILPFDTYQDPANSLAAASQCFLVWSCLCVCCSFRLPQHKQNMLNIWQWSGNRRANEAPRLEQKSSVPYPTPWRSKRYGMKIQPKFYQSWSCMGQIEPMFATPVILMYVAIWYRSGQRTSMVKYQRKQNFNDWFMFMSSIPKKSRSNTTIFIKILLIFPNWSIATKSELFHDSSWFTWNVQHLSQVLKPASTFLCFSPKYKITAPQHFNNFGESIHHSKLLIAQKGHKFRGSRADGANPVRFFFSFSKAGWPVGGPWVRICCASWFPNSPKPFWLWEFCGFSVFQLSSGLISGWVSSKVLHTNILHIHRLNWP